VELTCGGQAPVQLLTAGCGNGQQDEGEECDDGNRNAGDGCDAQCQNEAANDPRYYRCAGLDGPHQVWKMQPVAANIGSTCANLCANVGASGCAGRTGNTNDPDSCASGSGNNPAAGSCNAAMSANYYEWCYCTP